MANFVLFGEPMVFSDACIREREAMHQAGERAERAEEELKRWYEGCGNIENVISGYRAKAGELLKKYATTPLFESLTSFEIYTVTETTYLNNYVDTSKINEAFSYVSSDLNDIDDEANEQKAYRQARKDGRSRWQGGGFGLSGAIKGAVQAGALNAASGMAHGVFNSVANAGTSAKASLKKFALYNDESGETLATGVFGAVLDTHELFRNLVNSNKPGYYGNDFQPSEAMALFDNAKKIPEKRIELLKQSVRKFPCDVNLTYIFENYPEERDNACKIGASFGVDLSEEYEKEFEKKYTDEVKNDMSKAVALKAEIDATMERTGIRNSAVLNDIECRALEPYINGLDDADEETCNAMIAKIQDYKGQKKNKAKFIDIVNKRLEVHYKASDDRFFVESYLSTDLTNEADVAKLLKKLDRDCRSSKKNLYITLLQDSANPKGIDRAKKYQKGNKKRKTIGIILTVLGVPFLFAYCFGLVLLIPGVYFLISARLRYLAWLNLTMGECVFHKDVLLEKSKYAPGQVDYEKLEKMYLK